MDGPKDCHSEWSKSDREGEILPDIPYMRIRKDVTHASLFTKQSHRLREQTQVSGGAMARESGVDMYTLLYLKWIANKVLLYSTGNSAHCYVAGWMGGEFGGEGIHVNVQLSYFAVHQKLLTIIHSR